MFSHYAGQYCGLPSSSQIELGHLVRQPAHSRVPHTETTPRIYNALGSDNRA